MVVKFCSALDAKMIKAKLANSFQMQYKWETLRKVISVSQNSYLNFPK